MKIAQITIRDLFWLVLATKTFVCPMAAMGADPDDPRSENALPARIERVLDEAVDMRLVSVSPKRNVSKGAGFGDDERVSDWPELGEVRLDRAGRRDVMSALRKAVAAKEEQNKRILGGVGCFKPRHKLRVRHRGVTYDLLICFECHNARIYEDEKRIEGVGLLDASGDYVKVFNRLLRDANIEVAP